MLRDHFMRLRYLPMLAALLFTGACVERMTGRATQSVLSHAQRKIEGSGDLAANVTRRATGGMVEELTSQERRAEITQFSREAARAVTAGMHQELAEALGANGEGPLGVAIGGAVQRATQAAVFPQCTGLDREACIRSQVEVIARAASVGMLRTVRDQLGLGALIVAFVAGVGCTLVGLSTWRTLRPDNGRSRKHARAATSTEHVPLS
jgi:hypothetical protein